MGGCYKCIHTIAGREGQVRSVVGDERILIRNAS